jgi:hypothetical protein
MSISHPHAAATVAHHDAPPIGERAATCGRVATGHDEHSGVKSALCQEGTQSAVLCERLRKVLRSRLVGGGSKLPELEQERYSAPTIAKRRVISDCESFPAAPAQVVQTVSRLKQEMRRYWKPEHGRTQNPP